MSETGITRLLLIILVITWARKGTSLQCYVCTSVDDAACTSSLSGIEMSTCTSDESSNSSSTTTISAETTTSSDSVSTITVITDSSASSTYAETAEGSTSDSSTLKTSTYYVTSTQGDSTNNIVVSTTYSPSNTTEVQATEAVTSAATTTTQETTTAGTVSGSATTVPSENMLAKLLESETSEPVARVVRATDESFACYTLTLIKDGVTVTDRGCVVQSTSMCETLNEENYPSYNLSTCTTCTEDGCNSSPINMSGIPSVILPFIMFILTR